MRTKKTFTETIFTKSLLCFFSLAVVFNENFLYSENKEIPQQYESWLQWTTSLAIQAASYGSPIVTMYALRHNDAVGPKAKSKPNQIWRMEDVSTPELAKESGYVTPNVNVIYGFGFMDLREEPIIIIAPDSNGRYYMVEIVDMWTNAFAYIGGKSTGYKGGKFALVGPKWKGTLPTGVARIDCPTPWVLIQPRVHIYQDGKIDLDGAKKILQDIKPYALSEFTGKTPPAVPKYQYPAPDPVNPNLPVSVMDYKDPLQFWEILMLAMNENPPPEDQISALLPMFKSLGIELGKPWDRTLLRKELLEITAKVAKNIGNILSHLPFGTFYQNAFFPPTTIGDSGTDYKTRAIVARTGLTANTPFETVYWIYTLDQNAKPLSGDKTYTMTFKEEIPFIEPGFWSITMYDSENNYTVSNPLNRYMLGSDTPEMKKNADGSFTLYIQKESPGKDKESNWLPAPSGKFYLVPRSYAPTPKTIEILTNPKSWPVPAVMQEDE